MLQKGNTFEALNIDGPGAIRSRFMKAGKGDQYYSRQELRANPDRAQAFELQGDYCATAYWYMNKPANSLPPMAEVGERITQLP